MLDSDEAYIKFLPMLNRFLGNPHIAMSTLMILLAIGGSYWWLYERDDTPKGEVDAQIIAFEVRSIYKVPTPVKFARVRLLLETQERLVSWPEGRAVSCDVGDIVRLEQNEKGLQLVAQICSDR